MATARHLHLLGATGQFRTASYDNRDYIVVPVIALMEGVIHAVNAATPEFVPITSLAAAPSGWDGRPVVLRHPTKNGVQISANDPAILEAQGLGSIFKTCIKGKKLCLEAWIDPAKAEKIGAGKMLERIKNGEQIEVSVGAFVTTLESPGEHNGKKYRAQWKEITPDHLAFLPEGVGACSLSMGCGAHRAAALNTTHLVTAEAFEVLGDFGSTELERLALKILASKYKDCETCGGTGQVKDGDKQQDCPTCGGNGEIRAAAGARHNTEDVRLIQTVHDHAVSLGADCKPELREMRAACGCQGETMTKTERIAALMANAFNPLKNQKALEAIDEKELTTLEAHCESAAKSAADLKAATEKQTADLKAATEKVATTEAALKAAESKQLTEEQFMAAAPASVKSIITQHQAREAAEKTALITSLKTAAAGVYSEEELKAMDNAQLIKLASLAKAELPADFSGQGIPIPRTAASGEDFSTPDPYEAGLKVLKAATVN